MGLRKREEVANGCSDDGVTRDLSAQVHEERNFQFQQNDPLLLPQTHLHKPNKKLRGKIARGNRAGGFGAR